MRRRDWGIVWKWFWWWIQGNGNLRSKSEKGSHGALMEGGDLCHLPAAEAAAFSHSPSTTCTNWFPFPRSLFWFLQHEVCLTYSLATWNCLEENCSKCAQFCLLWTSINSFIHQPWRGHDFEKKKKPAELLSSTFWKFIKLLSKFPLNPPTMTLNYDSQLNINKPNWNSFITIFNFHKYSLNSKNHNH